MPGSLSGQIAAPRVENLAQSPRRVQHESEQRHAGASETRRGGAPVVTARDVWPECLERSSSLDVTAVSYNEPRELIVSLFSKFMSLWRDPAKIAMFKEGRAIPLFTALLSSTPHFLRLSTS